MKTLVSSRYLVIALIIMTLFLVQGLALAGVTGKVSGTIKDANSGEPLIGANIIIVGSSLGAAADEEGHYFIVNVPPGTYEIEARMMGYESVRKTGVRVIIDHTSPVDFDLKVTALETAEVTIVAQREVVQMDMSATQVAASIEDIRAVPIVNRITEYINLQAGIENDQIRGGGLDETQFMMDGLVMVDNRVNQPLNMVNMSSVKEISVVKGGFTAEYGNLRSGLINVVTKEGTTDRYHASIDFRYTPAHRKHSGESIFSPDNWFLKPYLAPEVAMVGTKTGWAPQIQNQYKTFAGWEAISKGYLNDSDPNNDMTPAQARDLFLWLHRAEGSGKFGQKEGEYGHKPDYFIDGSFGGPVPLIGPLLGDLTFFASYSENWELFALPTSRDYYRENNGLFKLTSHLSKNMKLTLDGLYGEIRSVASARGGQYYGDEKAYALNGSDILYFSYMDMGNGDINGLYYPGFFTPYTIFNTGFGISFDHVLSPRTFYNVRVSWIEVKQRAKQGQEVRDPAILHSFGNYGVNESPYGVIRTPTPLLMVDGMYYGAHCDGARDNSRTTTLNIKFDYTSQINRYNQLKFGFQYNYDDLFSHTEFNRWESDWENRLTEWHHYPYRIGGYIQDKIEFRGMIANLGFRMEYIDPNTDWVITDDKYSKYFRARYEHLMFQEMEQERAKRHLLIQPRLGISHPISENAKLYFNYGHFNSMPQSYDIYRINWWRKSDGPYFVGNPNVAPPRTVAYELGWEYNLGDMFMFHLSGYYKDITDQTGDIQYTSYDRLVDYRTVDNNEYEDIRGFEVTIEKRYGPWITGWINYNYQVNTLGHVGRYQYYEDLRENALYGLYNPYQEVPLARPWARANIAITTPIDFGPSVLNGNPLANIQWNILFHYKSGGYETWDPLVTRKLKDNLHWKSRYVFDTRFSRAMRLAGLNFELFLDIQNLWENREGSWTSRAFENDTDKRRYLESLHLPQYKDDIYKSAGYIGGDDQAGDLRPDDIAFDPWEKEKLNPNNDPAIAAENEAIRERNQKREENKAYIDNPNRDFLLSLNPRAYILGIRIDL